MEIDNQKTKSHQKFLRLFSKNHRDNKSTSCNSGEITDAAEDESDDDSRGGSFFRWGDIDPCISTNDLRIFVGTWNVAGKSPVGSLAVDLDDWLNLNNAADIYVLGFQEIVPLKTLNVLGAEDATVGTSWNNLIGRTLNSKYGCPWLMPMLNTIAGEEERRGSPMKKEYKKAKEGIRFELLASKKMVGVFTSVWIRRELLRRYSISNVKVSSVACGVMGYLGNKGSVAVSMVIEGTSFCFVTAHLASGEKKGDEGRRNHQVSEIFRRTSFPRTPGEDHYPHPLTIFGHDRIFWLGDLNYRLCLEDNFARQLIKKQDWKKLQEFDQLRTEQEEGGVFEGWKEGNIEFAPTYKYSTWNCNRYSGGFPARSGEKQRTPAWCDRILWYGKGVKQLHYFRSEIKFSDHRPVSAIFSTQIEIKSSSVSAIHDLSPKAEKSPDDGEGKTTLLSLLMQDAADSCYHIHNHHL